MLVESATAGLFTTVVYYEMTSFVCVQQCARRLQVSSIQGRALPLLDIIGD